MRLFTIEPHGDIVEGWSVTPSGITLGESGRGRTLTVVPVLGHSGPESVILTEGALVRHPAGGLVLDSDPAGSPATRAGVLVRDQSGYRGGWTLFGARSECPLAGQPWPDGAYSCPMCGHARTPGQHVGVFDPPPPPMAAGWKAQGLAGAMGGGAEMIFLLEPGQEVCVSRGGRLYGRESFHIYTWNGIRFGRETVDERRSRLAMDLARGGSCCGERL